MRLRMHSLCPFTFTLVAALATSMAVGAPVTVFSENFNTSAGTTWVTSGPLISGKTWGAFTSTSPDFGVKIDGGVLSITNDSSASAQANGYANASLPINETTFTSAFNTKLTQNTEVITWQFNVRQSHANPTGVNSGNFGAALVLGGSHNTYHTQGNGYALVLGGPGSADPLRLVKFTGGLSGTLDDVIAASTPLADVGDEHLSVRVTYNPLTEVWGLFGRMDGTSFQDPATGTLSSLGSATDSTYTNTTLIRFAAHGAGGTTSSQEAKFDNITVTLAPEPAVLGGMAMLAMGLLRRYRYRRVAIHATVNEP